MHGNKWVAIMMGAAGNAIVPRARSGSRLRLGVPKDLGGFLKLCQALKAKGTPSGFALGNATGDSVDALLVWAHGGKLVDAKGNVVINSGDHRRAGVLEAALRDVHPRARCRLDPNNNKAFWTASSS
jgi:multiple sugar transport system substrate-binding protein